MPTFTSPFTGTVVQPTDVSYYDLQFSNNVQLYWPAVVNPTQVPAARIIDANPEGAGLSIYLPQADQGAVGTDILIRNVGVEELTVVDFDGEAGVLIAPGVAIYFYLVDNTTPAGVWSNVTFGAGISSADAASLAGNGLTALTGKLNTTQNIVEVSAPPTIADEDRAATYVWVSGNGTFTLPSVVGLTAGWYIGFRNGGTGTLTIQGQGLSQINGQPSIQTSPGDSGYIVYQQSTGNFFTVGLASPATSTFTAATYDVDAIVGNTFSLVSFAPIIQTYVALSGSRTQTLTVTLPAITQIYVISNDTASGVYNIEFEISGSVSSPVVVSAGQVVLMLSDGNTLYVISQTTSGTFFANNGSASAPSYSFVNDNETGMYLVGLSVLGLTANGVQMLEIDNSNLADPNITTPATFTAGLISGGTF